MEVACKIHLWTWFNSPLHHCQRDAHIAEVATVVLNTFLSGLETVPFTVAVLPSLVTQVKGARVTLCNGGVTQLNFRPGHHCMPSVTN